MPLKKILLAAGSLVVFPCIFGGCISERPVTTTAAAAPAPAPAIPAAATLTPVQNDLQSLIRQAAGLGGGWIVGASMTNIRNHRVQLAAQADRRAEQSPAVAADLKQSDTADLNRDGFVTLDEVLALRRGGISDAQIVERLRTTGYLFQVTERQQQYLRDRGVGQTALDAMVGMK